jgi:hypothetical protein
MSIWGNIPEWLSVVIALLALLGFTVGERERSILRKRNIASDNENNLSSVVGENNQNAITENDIDIRAELYSRILIGIMLGVALGPLFSWVCSGSFQGDFYYSLPYKSQVTSKAMINVFSAIILSTLLSFVYFRVNPRLTSIFVHWAERFVFSYVGFWFILLFAYVEPDSETHIYFLHTETFRNILICVITFMLVGFSSTPIDWIIYLTSKFGVKKP